MFGLWSKPRKADAKPAAASGPEANETAGILPALAAVDFAGVRHFSSIWDDSPHHVSDLNGALAEELADALFACAESRSPLGRIVVGQAGAGKTHLLGDLRRAVWERRGWFVLLDLGGVRDFWPTAALNYLDALHKPHPSGRTQGQELLARIAALRAATRPRNARQFDAIFLADDERILDLAARTLQNAIKEKPTFDDEKKDLIYNLGAVLESMGKKEEAIEQFKQIYEMDAGYKDVSAKVEAFYSGQ